MKVFENKTALAIAWLAAAVVFTTNTVVPALRQHTKVYYEVQNSQGFADSSKVIGKSALWSPLSGQHEIHIGARPTGMAGGRFPYRTAWVVPGGSISKSDGDMYLPMNCGFDLRLRNTSNPNGSSDTILTGIRMQDVPDNADTFQSFEPVKLVPGQLYTISDEPRGGRFRMCHIQLDPKSGEIVQRLLSLPRSEF